MEPIFDLFSVFKRLKEFELYSKPDMPPHQQTTVVYEYNDDKPNPSMTKNSDKSKS